MYMHIYIYIYTYIQVLLALLVPWGFFVLVFGIVAFYCRTLNCSRACEVPRPDSNRRLKKHKRKHVCDDHAQPAIPN